MVDPTLLRQQASGAIVVAVATFAASAGNYVLSIIAAHQLQPSEFGAWGAIAGALAILGTIGLAAQAVVARESSTQWPNRQEGTPGKRWWYLRLVPVTAGVALVLWIPMSVVLSVSIWVMGLTLATVPITVAASVVVGQLQGSRDFARLSWAILHIGLWRVAFGIAGLLLIPDLLGMSVGLLIGSMVGLVWGLSLARSVKTTSWRPPRQVQSYLVALQALALMFALSNVDILMARAILSPTESGSYAVGSLVAKIAFFLPSPILIVLYPYMVRRSDRLAVHAALMSTAVVGLAVTTICFFMPGTVSSVIADDALSGAAPYLWRFALAGTLLALVQVALYARLAVADSSVLVLLWVALAVLVAAIALQPDPSIVSIINVVALVAAVLSAVGFLMDRKPIRTVVPPIEIAD